MHTGPLSLGKQRVKPGCYSSSMLGILRGSRRCPSMTQEQQPPMCAPWELLTTEACGRNCGKAYHPGVGHSSGTQRAASQSGHGQCSHVDPFCFPGRPLSHSHALLQTHRLVGHQLSIHSSAVKKEDTKCSAEHSQEQMQIFSSV